MNPIQTQRNGLPPIASGSPVALYGFRGEFGVSMLLEDAERILRLYHEIEDLFERYSDGEMPLWQFFGA